MTCWLFFYIFFNFHFKKEVSVYICEPRILFAAFNNDLIVLLWKEIPTKIANRTIPSKKFMRSIFRHWRISYSKNLKNWPTSWGNHSFKTKAKRGSSSPSHPVLIHFMQLKLWHKILRNHGADSLEKMRRTNPNRSIWREWNNYTKNSSNTTFILETISNI